ESGPASLAYVTLALHPTTPFRLGLRIDFRVRCHRITLRGEFLCFWSPQAPLSQSITTAQFASSDRIPEPTSSPASDPTKSKKHLTNFSLGGASFSSTEQDQSLDKYKAVIPLVKNSMS
ncbi:hypothetical protein BKA56DRAFT_712159, partial [Ilyonectria sp. MPI-CAGE-AT-0026]